MKIIQISDTHLVAPGGQVYGIDPLERLAACIADINAHHADAAFCVLSGDLTNEGEPAAYRALADILAALRPPWHLMVGNHDDRAALLEVFPQTPVDENGFVQSVLDTPLGRVILLDTLEPGSHGGTFCAARAAWLAARLDEAEERPVYLFLHHPPLAIGLPSMDRMRLGDPGPLIEALRGRSNVRHLFFGHVHRPVSGAWRGIPFSAPKGTAHQVALDFIAVSPVPKTREAPTYAVILLGAEETVVHLHDYLDRSLIDGAVSPAPPGIATRGTATR
jgi:3',5'-cyclic AMP phosphodiesterase CpdA